MKLGNLEKINLREVWAREDTHFTQWLVIQNAQATMEKSITLKI